MKLVLLILFAAAGVAGVFAAETYLRAKFISPSEAEQKLGKRAFSRDLFRAGDETVRGSMSADMVKRQVYVGKPVLLLREELGDPDSYAFSDTIFAYRIMKFPGEGRENWHPIAVPDGKSAVIDV